MAIKPLEVQLIHQYMIVDRLNAQLTQAQQPTGLNITSAELQGTIDSARLVATRLASAPLQKQIAEKEASNELSDGQDFSKVITGYAQLVSERATRMLDAVRAQEARRPTSPTLRDRAALVSASAVSSKPAAQQTPALSVSAASSKSLPPTAAPAADYSQYFPASADDFDFSAFSEAPTPKAVSASAHHQSFASASVSQSPASASFSQRSLGQRYVSPFSSMSSAGIDLSATPTFVYPAPQQPQQPAISLSAPASLPAPAQFLPAAAVPAQHQLPAVVVRSSMQAPLMPASISAQSQPHFGLRLPAAEAAPSFLPAQSLPAAPISLQTPSKSDAEAASARAPVSGTDDASAVMKQARVLVIHGTPEKVRASVEKLGDTAIVTPAISKDRTTEEALRNTFRAAAAAGHKGTIIIDPSNLPGQAVIKAPAFGQLIQNVLATEPAAQGFGRIVLGIRPLKVNTYRNELGGQIANAVIVDQQGAIVGSKASQAPAAKSSAPASQSARKNEKEATAPAEKRDEKQKAAARKPTSGKLEIDDTPVVRRNRFGASNAAAGKQ